MKEYVEERRSEGEITEYKRDRDETGGVYLSSQLERTLHLCT
jgi:hypothetical protein